jgi:hypothetical protein
MEHSNSLRQNVDAYATNIDGFGHRFEPAIDFDADDADQRVADSIYLDRVAARDRSPLPKKSPPASASCSSLPALSGPASSRSSTSAASTTPSSTCAGGPGRTSRSAATPSGRCSAMPVARWLGSCTCRRSPCASCPSTGHPPRSRTVSAFRR